MKMHYVHRALFWASIISIELLAFGPKSFLGTRSQSVDAYFELAGWERAINTSGKDGCEPVFSVAVRYSRSTDHEKMARILFDSSSVVFSGSRVPNREKQDILADYFGLPNTFKSAVCFNPIITTFCMDFSWYHDLSCLAPGLYYRIHAPIAHTKWDLNLSERIINPAVAYNKGEPVPAAHPAGYLGADRILLSDIPKSVESALQGKLLFGDIREPLLYGKVFGRQTLTRIADVHCAVGWNFLLSDWYHVGCNARLVVPFGNRTSAEFLFEPIVGDNAHWGAGVGFTSHVDLWYGRDEQHAIALYVDANVTHLFSARQRRSFDLITNGRGSRYMLLTDNGSPAHNLFFTNTGNVGGIRAHMQYQRKLVPAINKTTFDIMVSIAIQTDIAIKCAYIHHNFEWDIGYGLWTRSKERGVRCQRLEENRFGIKGDAQLYGFDNIPVPPAAYSLNVTQSQATIQGGQGAGNFEPGREYANINSDSAQQAFGDTVPFEQLTISDANALGVNRLKIGASADPVFLKDTDIDIRSGLSACAITHTFFSHINYSWRGYVCYTPYIGIGAMVEIASCDIKNNNGYGQWGMWLKGGIAY